MKKILILFALIIFLWLGYYGVGFLNKNNTDIAQVKNNTPETTNSNQTETTKPTSEPKTNSNCATLSNSEKENINLWKTYTNSKYGYSFKYPQTWILASNEEKSVIFKDNEASLEFRFASEEMTNFGLVEYSLDSSIDVTIACVKTTKSSLTNQNSPQSKIIFTKFNKNDQDHMAMLSYQDQGASLSSDIIESYDLILKTIEFK